MNLTITYFVYLLISLGVTIWVARVCHEHGRYFLVKSFHGNESLADSVNDLLVVGFYLVNFGYVCLALSYGTKPTDLNEAIEFLSTKIGFVLLILGIWHYGNLLVFTRIGRDTKPRVRSEEIPFADVVPER